MLHALDVFAQKSEAAKLKIDGFDESNEKTFVDSSDFLMPGTRFAGGCARPETDCSQVAARASYYCDC
jgi:hypothetical protein